MERITQIINECKYTKTAKAKILASILVLSFLMSAIVIPQATIANGQWVTTPIDTDCDGEKDLDLREYVPAPGAPRDVHLDLNRNGKIDEGEPYHKGATVEIRPIGHCKGYIIVITPDIRTYDPEGGEWRPKVTYRVKDEDSDGFTDGEGECNLILSEGGPSTKFIDPTYDLIHVYTDQPASPEEYSEYLDVTMGEANKTEDKLEFRMTINGGISSLDQSTFWTILMDENNYLEGNCMDYPTANVDTMYSVIFQEPTKEWTIERAKYESWGWDVVSTDATFWLDGYTTIIVSIPLLELDEFQGILTWKVMTDSASYVGDLAPDWGSVTLVLGLGPPQPQIVGQLDRYTISGDNVSVEAIEMTPSVDRYDIVSCSFEYSSYGSEFWTFIGEDTEPDDGWGVTWDISDLSEGKYTVRATMMTGLGMIGMTDTLIFYDPTPPTPEFIDMEYGKFVEGTTTIEVGTLDENPLFVEFYFFFDATNKTKPIPEDATQKRADDCGPYAAAACLSYWTNYKNKKNEKPFKDLCEDTKKAREDMAEDLYKRVGKSKASADKLVKAINDYIGAKNVQGLKAKKLDKADWDTAKKEFDQCQDVLLLLHYPDCRRHWVTLDGYDGDFIDLMDPGAETGDLGARLKNGKICHNDAEGNEVCAKIEDIVTVCPTDRKSHPCDPYLGTDFDGSDGWGIEWNTTEVYDGAYMILAKMVDEDDNEQTSMTLVYVNIHPTDINRDGIVNILDIAIVAQAYGAKYNETDGMYWHDPPCKRCPHTNDADLNGDKEINILDIAKVAKDYGKTY